MTFIPLAIFSQAIQQLPLARHDQDHEIGAGRGGGRRRRLPQPPRAEQQLLDVQRHQPAAAPDGNSGSASPSGGAFKNWVSVPGPNAGNEQFRYNVDTTQTASSGLVYLTSSGRSRTVIRDR